MSVGTAKTQGSSKQQQFSVPRNPPGKLQRLPDANQSVDRATADSAVKAAAHAVITKLEKRRSKVATVKAYFLGSIVATHDAIVALFKSECRDKAGPSILSLTRLQVERTFFGLLFFEDANHWLPIYDKYEWAATFHERFNDRCRFAGVDKYDEALDEMVNGILEIGRVSHLTAEELQNAEHIMRTGDANAAPAIRYETPPKASEIAKNLKTPALQNIARWFYHDYSELNQFAHGGLSAAIYEGVRRKNRSDANWDTYYYKRVISNTLQRSYVATLTVATLFGVEFKNDLETMTRLIQGWTDSKSCDATTLGVVVWDEWARSALNALA